MGRWLLRYHVTGYKELYSVFVFKEDAVNFALYVYNPQHCESLKCVMYNITTAMN